MFQWSLYVADILQFSIGLCFIVSGMKSFSNAGLGLPLMSQKKGQQNGGRYRSFKFSPSPFTSSQGHMGKTPDNQKSRGFGYVEGSQGLQVPLPLSVPSPSHSVFSVQMVHLMGNNVQVWVQ